MKAKDIRALSVEDRQKDTLLFAGDARVNITDWFFLKDKATLKYVALDDAIVNMQRTDSVWNYQFLVDYFSSPKKSNSSNGGIEFDLQVIQLENVFFNKQDKWVGQDMKVAIKKLDLKADTVNFNSRRIYISDLKLDAPYFLQSNYTGNKPKVDNDNLRDLVPKIPVLSALQWNTEGWMVSIKNIDLTNASFINEKETLRQPYTDRFDGQHLAFTSITGTHKNAFFLNDTLTTDIKLKAKEKRFCGLHGIHAKD